MYGTTQATSHNNGTVFELSPVVGGGWTFTKLFTSLTSNEGISPSTNLVMDGAGNLFGAALSGGYTYDPVCYSGCGLIFELSPNGDGGWTQNVLYYFVAPGNPTDGALPIGRLVMDAAGNLYGTTEAGGVNNGQGGGTVFEVSPQAGGGWKETILYRFGNFTADGNGPRGGLTFDRQGNLYGTATNGGPNPCSNLLGCGIVFELSLVGGGWTEKILHTFNGTDGAYPSAPVIFDRAGNLYSTTDGGGPGNVGAVFALQSGSGGNWHLQVLHTFNAPTGGQRPGYSGVTLDAKGNLDGSTTQGGNATCLCGVVYQLVPNSSGQWKSRVRYAFTGGEDGSGPDSTLILDRKGNLYGTALAGGAGSAGTVFEITP